MIVPEGKDFLYCDQLDDEALFALLATKKYSLRNAAAMTLMYRKSGDNYTRAYQLCFHQDFKLREMGASILGEISRTTAKAEQEILALLQSLALKDSSSRVRAVSIASFGMRCARASGTCKHLVDIFFKVSRDISGRVRTALAFIMLYTPSKKLIPLAEQLLNDTDQNVRHGAAFSVGVNKWDTSKIRDALLSCLADTLPECREEAIYTLALLGDKRVLPALSYELGKEFVVFRMLEAAANLGDESMLPVLKNILLSFGGEEVEGEEIARRQYRRLQRKVKRQRQQQR